MVGPSETPIMGNYGYTDGTTRCVSQSCDDVGERSPLTADDASEDEQHLLVGRQGPQVVCHVVLQQIGCRTDPIHRR